MVRKLSTLNYQSTTSRSGSALVAACKDPARTWQPCTPLFSRSPATFAIYCGPQPTALNLFRGAALDPGAVLSRRVTILEPVCRIYYGRLNS